MANQGPKVVFGGGPIGDGKEFSDVSNIEELYKLLREGGCDTIDTARLYGNSEETIGKTHGGDQFIIDSKTPGGFIVGESTSAGILQHAKDTVERLGVKNVDVYYIHSPDRSLELEDMLKGISDAYKAGYFKRFGLSNYTADEVEQVYAICKEKGYPLPTVYQGNYSAAARRAETELFPTLRKLNMAFYAYSPLAGGLLTKTKEQIIQGKDAGRFVSTHWLGSQYGDLYGSKPSYHKALDMWGDAAQAAGCSRGELAYRWVAFDSQLDPEYGDAIVFGASKLPQVTETLAWLKKGSVGEEAKATIDKIWEVVEKDAPLDNFNC